MSSHDTKNPNGEVRMGHVVEKPDPNAYLLERILSRENMLLAWKRVKANHGAPGIDGMTIEAFPEYLREHWKAVRESILSGTYQPLPVRRTEIPKQTGGTRPLGIPIVLDRLIQQAIAQVLVPIFDPGFSESSFGFRPGRSAHNAVRQVREYIRKGYRVAVDMDLSKFFDTVNHDALMLRVARKSPRQTGASPDRKVPPCRSGGERTPPEDSERGSSRRSVVSAFGKHPSG